MFVLAFVAAILAETNFEKFNNFIKKYEKSYKTLEEYEYRFKVFEQTLERIDVQNREHVARGGEDGVFGVNVFADLTKEEFEVRLMKNLPYNPPTGPETYNFAVPTNNVDWRNSGVVTPVKDQGQCGSCWAHSADEAIESFYGLSKGLNGSSLLVLSVEQCTACTYNYDGCNGGWPYDAYNYAVIQRAGIDLDKDYPYNIAQAGNCKFGATGDADKPAANIKSYKNVARGSLATALNDTGPVSVCVAAESWQTYTKGILSVCPGSVDHCVQAVGYNTQGSTPYWVVRNSWGTGWGVEGYIYLDLNANSGDICHIQEYVTYPTL